MIVLNVLCLIVFALNFVQQLRMLLIKSEGRSFSAVCGWGVAFLCQIQILTM